MGPYNLQRTKNDRDKSSAYIIQKGDTSPIKKIPKKSGSQPLLYNITNDSKNKEQEVEVIV